MKISIDKNYLLKQLFAIIIIFSIIIGTNIIILNDNHTSYLGNPIILLSLFAVMLLTSLIFAFARGAIRFSAGNAKDD